MQVELDNIATRLISEFRTEGALYVLATNTNIFGRSPATADFVEKINDRLKIITGMPGNKKLVRLEQTQVRPSKEFKRWCMKQVQQQQQYEHTPSGTATAPTTNAPTTTTTTAAVVAAAAAVGDGDTESALADSIDYDSSYDVGYQRRHNIVEEYNRQFPRNTEPQRVNYSDTNRYFVCEDVVRGIKCQKPLCRRKHDVRQIETPPDHMKLSTLPQWVRVSYGGKDDARAVRSVVVPAKACYQTHGLIRGTIDAKAETLCENFALHQKCGFWANCVKIHMHKDYIPKFFRSRPCLTCIERDDKGGYSRFIDKPGDHDPHCPYAHSLKELRLHPFFKDSVCNYFQDYPKSIVLNSGEVESADVVPTSGAIRARLPNSARLCTHIREKDVCLFQVDCQFVHLKHKPSLVPEPTTVTATPKQPTTVKAGANNTNGSSNSAMSTPTHVDPAILSARPTTASSTPGSTQPSPIVPQYPPSFDQMSTNMTSYRLTTTANVPPRCVAPKFLLTHDVVAPMFTFARDCSLKLSQQQMMSGCAFPGARPLSANDICSLSQMYAPWLSTLLTPGFSGFVSLGSFLVCPSAVLSDSKDPRVCLGIRPDIGHPVVVKSYHSSKWQHGTDLHAIGNRAMSQQSIAGLAHPFSFHIQNDDAGFVLHIAYELYEITLSKALSLWKSVNYTPLYVSLVRGVITDVLHTLSEVHSYHSNFVLHPHITRDITSTSVMADASGRWHITDTAISSPRTGSPAMDLTAVSDLVASIFGDVRPGSAWDQQMPHTAYLAQSLCALLRQPNTTVQKCLAHPFFWSVDECVGFFAAVHSLKDERTVNNVAGVLHTALQGCAWNAAFPRGLASPLTEDIGQLDVSNPMDLLRFATTTSDVVTMLDCVPSVTVELWEYFADVEVGAKLPYILVPYMKRQAARSTPTSVKAQPMSADMNLATRAPMQPPVPAAVATLFGGAAAGVAPSPASTGATAPTTTATGNANAFFDARGASFFAGLGGLTGTRRADESDDGIREAFSHLGGIGNLGQL
eukprot:PhM_4_TR3408/c0_g1_i1/m.83388